MLNSSPSPAPTIVSEDIAPLLPPKVGWESPKSQVIDQNGVPSLNMSLEEMLALAAKKYHMDVEACNSELVALREKNLALTRQLHTYYKRNTQSNAFASEDQRPIEEVAMLPNAIMTSPRECQQTDVEDLEALKAASISTPSSSAWMLTCQSSQHRSSVKGGNTSEIRRSSARASTRQEYKISEVWDPSGLKCYSDRESKICVDGSFSLERFDSHGSTTMDRDSQLPHTVDAPVPRFIGLPTDPKRLAWDFIGAILIFYDLFKLPMDAFGPPESDFSMFMDWFILLFWTANVGASLTVGYLDHGEMVMSPPKIALRYLKTWFIIDLLVVVPDWVFTMTALTAPAENNDNSGGDTDNVKLLRVLRLVRMVRLLRLLKLRKIFETFSGMINSEYVSVVANIVKMILMLLVINHLICCVWFLLAESQKQYSSTWITVHGFDDVHWLYKYTTAFHWSITQFTPASMHVQPQNILERTFTIVVVVFALVGFSYIVGSITGSLGQLRNMHAEESKLFWDLRRYLAKNKVNTKLSLRIQKYLEHAWQSQQECKPAKDVKLMQLLSDQLRAELKYALALEQLKIHPFLDQLAMYSSITVHRLANCAISHKLLAAGDALFHLDETATHMYIVVEGSYLYRRKDAAGEPRDEKVDKGEDWIAEPVLWIKSWIHRGVLVAINEGDNLTIDAKNFSEQVKLNPQAHLFASGYARNFVAWLNDLDRDDLSDISQGEDVGELFHSFIPTDVFDQLRSVASSRRF